MVQKYNQSEQEHVTKAVDKLQQEVGQLKYLSKFLIYTSNVVLKIACTFVSSNAVAVTAHLIGWTVRGSARVKLMVDWSLTVAVRVQ